MKNKIIKEIIVLFTLLVIVGFLIFLLLDAGNLTTSQMDDELRKMAEDFYNDYYYDDISKGKSDDELKEFLSKYKDTGFKVNLKNLLDYDENLEDIINKFKINGNNCDREGTKAIIYPTDPYEKTNYKIETIIDCQ